MSKGIDSMRIGSAMSSVSKSSFKVRNGCNDGIPALRHYRVRREWDGSVKTAE